MQPFSILQPLADVTATADSGELLATAGRHAQLETLVREGISTAELEIPFELPQRSAKSVKLLKGKLVALVPGVMEDFRFDELPLAAGGARPKAIAQRKAGTTVTVDSVRTNNDIWEVNLRIRFDAPSTALESHRSWVFNNQAYFTDAAGTRLDFGGLEQTLHTNEELGFKYLFDLPNGPAKLTFVYRSPLMVLEMPVEYEFHDLPLP